MSSYVLVHGALGGSWQFTRVAERLRSHGHRVLTPTLTGQGDRVHLASLEVGLDTHVRDVVASVESEGLTEALLVGYGYGGTVITAAAEDLRGRMSGLIYVDAFAPRDGQSTFDLFPAKTRECVRTLVREHDGWRLPPVEKVLALLGIADCAERPWALERLTPFPIRCWEQPARLRRGVAETLHRDYVDLAGADHPVFGPLAERARREAWGYQRIDADHCAWMTRPEALADALEATQ